MFPLLDLLVFVVGILRNNMKLVTNFTFQITEISLLKQMLATELYRFLVTLSQLNFTFPLFTSATKLVNIVSSLLSIVFLLLSMIIRCVM